MHLINYYSLKLSGPRSSGLFFVLVFVVICVFLFLYLTRTKLLCLDYTGESRRETSGSIFMLGVSNVKIAGFMRVTRSFSGVSYHLAAVMRV